MADFAVFLRGMNLGGRRITNEELRRRFEDLGLGSVGTFRASGNVVFSAPEADQGAERELIARIERGLAGALGYEVPTFLRRADEVRAIAAHQPFEPRLIEGSRGKLQVSLLGGEPSGEQRHQILSLAGADDLLSFGRRELYWLPSGGIMDSDLDVDVIGAVLGPVTMRTKGTIDAIAARFFADPEVGGTAR
jgi:uncharacterized protein (DUF1697 family)